MWPLLIETERRLTSYVICEVILLALLTAETLDGFYACGSYGQMIIHLILQPSLAVEAAESERVLGARSLLGEA